MKTTEKRALLAALSLALSAGAGESHAASNVMQCTLAAQGAGYQGDCMVPCQVNDLQIDFDGPGKASSCDRPDRSVKATLSPAAKKGRWLGTMKGRFPEDPTRFELIDRQGDVNGIAKTPFGWFAVTQEITKDGTLQLTIDANRQLPPTQDDLQILARAKALIPNEAAWNRQDTRDCPAGATKYSLFCALRKATEDVSGGVHYRQPALQAVREVVRQVAGDKIKKHRLMEYNNSPQTSLDDIYLVLDSARARMEKAMRQGSD